MAQRPVALVTGGSRGIGAATVLAVAARDYDVALTYHNKAARADAVVQAATALGVRTLAIGGDMTEARSLQTLTGTLQAWSPSLTALVLNASGGLERDRLSADPQFPMRINHDAQLALLERMVPLLVPGGVVVFVTSHWAHLHGQVEQLPGYEPVAASKNAGEQALRSRQADLQRVGLRLVVVTGDLIEGTITPRLLERAAPGLAGQRRAQVETLPTADDMATAVADAVTNAALPNGATVLVGGPLEALTLR
jgi:NAD(P)-dependent dehydrogenase (short-subunit alcohol dehydrogenase family)